MAAQPGCIESKRIPLPPRRRDHSRIERHLRPLRASVGTRTVVRLDGILEIVQVQALGVLPARRDRDDPRSRRSLEQWEQPTDQGERTDHQGREHRLDAVRSDPSLWVDRSGIVDDHVEARLGREDARDRGTDRAERAHVRDDGREPVLAGRHRQFVPHGREPRLVASHQDDSGTGVGELAGGLPTEPGRRTGDEHRTTVERTRADRLPAEQRAPSAIPERRETTHDRDLKRIIEDEAWIHGNPFSDLTARATHPGARRRRTHDGPHDLEAPMTTLRERIETPLPIDDTFAYVADFANSQEWDPGVATAERLDTGPVGVGTRYRLGVRLGGRVAPMEYRISVFEPPNRVVLTGTGSGVTAVDDIRFTNAGDMTRVDYTAEIKLGGVLGLIQPLLGRAFANLGRNAVEGMQRTLDDRAASAEADRS